MDAPTKPSNRTNFVIRCIQYIYFLRFSLLLAIAIFGFPYLATRIAPTMFGGMLVLNEPSEMIVVSLFTFIACWVVMISSRLTLIYGPERFGIEAPFKINDAIRWWHLVLWGMLGIPICIAVVSHSPDINVIPGTMAVLFGYGISLALLFLADIVQRLLLINPQTDAPDILFPSNAASHRAQGVDLKLGLLSRLTCACVKRVPYSLGSGYFDYKNNCLYPGHALSAALLLVQTGIYLSGYVFLAPDISRLGGNVPALAYVMVLLVTLGFVFTALAFFLDLLRVPVLITAVAWSILMYSAFDSDHYYTLQPRPATSVNPHAAIDGWATRNKPEQPLIVVTASGGGIQAAAWAAKVMAELQVATNGKFAPSVGLISSVSGGSVGTIFFINKYSKAGFPTNPDSLAEIVSKAEQPSLNETAWGLVYPDTLRSIAPILVYPKTKDRSWAMEQAWRRDWSGKSTTLASWAEDVNAGIKPAVILNATLAEDGTRYLLTNFDAPPQVGTRSLSSLYLNHDIDVVTAARLSATFPYVSPMPRPLIPEEKGYKTFHVGDGGYYDNFGVVSAVEWLRAELPYFENKYHGKHVVFIQIRGRSEGEPNPQERWGYRKQMAGPLLTLLNVRTSAQLARNRSEVEMLKRIWEGDSSSGKTMDVISFCFNGTSPTPLSWSLTKTEQNAINNYQFDQYKIAKIRSLLTNTSYSDHEDRECN